MSVGHDVGYDQERANGIEHDPEPFYVFRLVKKIEFFFLLHSLSPIIC